MFGRCSGREDAVLCVWKAGDVHMRTNIEIDDEVMERALKLTGAATKREAVHRALVEMVERAERIARQREALRQLRGIDPDWGANLPNDDPLKPER